MSKSVFDLQDCRALSRCLYPSHTRAATVLRPYCDQFFDQIALDRSKVSLRSHCSLNVVAVGRTSRRMVVLVVLVAVRNFGMQSVCCLSAHGAVAVRSPNVTLHSHTALTARDL